MEKEEEYKGIFGVRSEITEKAASTDEMPLNSRTTAPDWEVYLKRTKNQSALQYMW